MWESNMFIFRSYFKTSLICKMIFLLAIVATIFVNILGTHIFTFHFLYFLAPGKSAGWWPFGVEVKGTVSFVANWINWLLDSIALVGS